MCSFELVPVPSPGFFSFQSRSWIPQILNFSPRPGSGFYQSRPRSSSEISRIEIAGSRGPCLGCPPLFRRRQIKGGTIETFGVDCFDMMVFSVLNCLSIRFSHKRRQYNLYCIRHTIKGPWRLNLGSFQKVKSLGCVRIGSMKKRIKAHLASFQTIICRAPFSL